MSANHVHLVKSASIRHKVVFDVGESYSITAVNPTTIDNDDVVIVEFNTTNPSETDWVGAYSPSSVNVLHTSPIKFGYCGAPSQSTYLSNGIGQLAFNLTNLRADVKFYYFTNDVVEPLLVAESAEIVGFTNVNQPLRNRVVPTGDPNVLQLLWSSATSETPTLKWGTIPGEYTNIVNADTSVIHNSSLCGGAATGFGWRDLGLIHTANFTGLVDLNLANTNISYVFGDAATDDYSGEFNLFVPPLAGTQPPNRPTTVVLYADMGVGSSDNSYDTTVWREQCPPAVNTSNSVADLVLRGEVDAVFHSGDISYANGYLSGWDFFLDMVSPIAGRVPYLTTMGNHESDWPGTDSIPGYGKASGGECSVVSAKLLPMPAPATVKQPWWSYDIGLIHFVGMSTEHNFTYHSPQYQWLERDLAQTNRSLTPWVIFSGHRPMYVDSNDCCNLGTTHQCAAANVPCEAGYDVQVMEALQANIEPLLYKYQVNLAFAGHFHNVQRQSAVYQNKMVQRAVLGADDSGNPCYYHNNPNATVWMLVGSAGNGPVYSSANYTWSEKYWNDMFGYAIVAATNSTHLSWKFINSANNDVIDRMVITQNFAPWGTPQVVASGGGGKSGWASLSAAAQGGIIATIIIVVAMLGAGVALFIRAKSPPRKADLTVQQANHSHSVDGPPKRGVVGTISPLQQPGMAGSEMELGNVA